MIAYSITHLKRSIFVTKNLCPLSNSIYIFQLKIKNMIIGFIYSAVHFFIQFSLMKTAKIFSNSKYLENGL